MAEKYDAIIIGGVANAVGEPQHSILVFERRKVSV
jgi:hypothetical protein